MNLRAITAGAVAAVLLTASQSAAQPQAASPVGAAPDYAQDAAWLCRPGRTDVCDAPLDVLVQRTDGAREVRTFAEAADPPVDCFYVYPTVSLDAGPISDLTPGPEEVRTTVGQAARFASRCRLFVPVYRQVTLAGLGTALRGRGQADWSTGYEDVRTAWRDYLRRDNGGRGVVLIGHSQGAIVLAHLLAEDVGADPSQRRLLVSAILAGHPGLPARDGAIGEGAASIPLCRAAAQTGCALVWATFAAADASTPGFGRSAVAGTPAACVNPAAPGGGAGTLRSFLRRPPDASADDPPYVEVSNLVAECVTVGAASVLRVSPAPGADAAVIERTFATYAGLPGWGLHALDLTLTQGTLLDLIDAQARAWTAAQP